MERLLQSKFARYVSPAHQNHYLIKLHIPSILPYLGLDLKETRFRVSHLGLRVLKVFVTCLWYLEKLVMIVTCMMVMTTVVLMMMMTIIIIIIIIIVVVVIIIL